METKELFLKTLFCCSACDGDIAPEEVALVKELSVGNAMFEGMDVETTLNKYVDEINDKSKIFLKDYLNEISESELNDADQVKLLGLAIKMIEADNQILYSEVKFFKKIRNRMSVSDESIIAKLPNSEDYLLPDIMAEEKDFEEVGNFAKISFSE